jgi:hypothetical protein
MHVQLKHHLFYYYQISNSILELLVKIAIIINIFKLIENIIMNKTSKHLIKRNKERKKFYLNGQLLLNLIHNIEKMNTRTFNSNSISTLPLTPTV